MFPSSKAVEGHTMKAHTEETIRFDVDELPELDTNVGIAGTARQQEVGGPACIGFLAGLAIYYSI